MLSLRSNSGQSPIALIVFIVLFIVAAVFGYVVYMALVELSEKVGYKEAGVAGIQDAIGEFNSDHGSSVSSLEEMVNKGNADWTRDLNKLNERESVVGWASMKGDDIRKEFEQYSDYSDRAKNIEDLVRLLREDLREARQELESAKNGQNEATKQVKALREKVEGFIKNKEINIDDLRKEINDKDDELASKAAEYEQQLANSDAKINDLLDKHEADKEEWLDEEDTLKLKIAKLDQRLKELVPETEEMGYEPEKADGKIISTDLKYGFGFIDQGRKDKIRKGMVFTVYQVAKGDKIRIKGRAEVKEVGEAVSKVALTHFDKLDLLLRETYEKYMYVEIMEPDVLDPIVPGDFIINPAFDKKASKIFVFAGGFRSYSNKEARKLVEKYGSIVHDDVTVQTDYVVVGTASEEKMAAANKVISKARQFGKVIMTESDFLAYIE